MKKKALILITLVSLFSCDVKEEEKKPLQKKFSVLMSNDNNWSGSELECDSFNMVSKTQVNVWIDNSKSTVHANCLRIKNNENGSN